MDGDHEVQAREDGRKSRNKNSQTGFNNFCICKRGAERGIESPTGIDAARQHAMQHHHAADDVEVPAKKVNARESQIFRPDHQGHQEVSEHRGNGGDQEEKHHDHSMHGEKFVVSIGLHQIARGSEQLEADEQRKKATNEKEERDRDEIKKRDAFVISGEQPRPHSVLLVQIILAFNGLSDRGSSHTHCT